MYEIDKEFYICSYDMFKERKERSSSNQGYGIMDSETMTGRELQNLLDFN